MDKAIINLNRTTENREIMVQLIMNRTPVKSNYDYEQVRERTENLPYLSLHKKMIKLYGEDYKTVYAIN